MTLQKVFLLFSTALLISCGNLVRPYKCDPVLSKDDLEIFKKQNEFLGLKVGDTFADLGASSGYYDGAMAVFLDSVTFYLNDIDEKCLNEKNLGKLLKYYSGLKGSSIEATNPFHAVIGTATRTNLPENTFDVVFTNGTVHVLEFPDSILTDIHKNLKADGHLFVRDEFVFNDEIKPCSYKKCKSPVLRHEPFMAMMNRNHFVLVDESHDFGYPIYKFAKI